MNKELAELYSDYLVERVSEVLSLACRGVEPLFHAQEEAIHQIK